MDQSKICAKNDANIKKKADRYLGDSALCQDPGKTNGYTKSFRCEWALLSI